MRKLCHTVADPAYLAQSEVEQAFENVGSGAASWIRLGILHQVHYDANYDLQIPCGFKRIPLGDTGYPDAGLSRPTSDPGCLWLSLCSLLLDEIDLMPSIAAD